MHLDSYHGQYLGCVCGEVLSLKLQGESPLRDFFVSIYNGGVQEQCDVIRRSKLAR